ncbi:metallophosphoesterase [Winogradskyella sp. 3972H.M.0a.05]|uniref:metallophosphoesterase family protein n=1 Tax=Winogradskyella sp. 3972H.M.0a.05 TaxID=2950277 RepID=UPI003398E8FB
MKNWQIFFLISFFISCDDSKQLSNSFFIAGHTYGSPELRSNEDNTDKGLYKPFIDKFQFLEDQPKMDFGFLLGDCVWKPNEWPIVMEQMKELEIPTHIARGNHDGGLKLFKKNFGDSYKKFVHKDNLYIVLDSNIDSWNISDDQLVFLMNALRNEGSSVNNIFIFSHHLLWYSKTKFSKPFPNSLSGRPETTNFWSKIEPLLKNQTTPVYIFAGDVGAFSKEKRKKDHIIEYYYHNYDNITFVASGMGGGVRDNLIVVDVLKDGTVDFRLIHLNGTDINGLGKLQDYVDPNFTN